MRGEIHGENGPPEAVESCECSALPLGSQLRGGDFKGDTGPSEMPWNFSGHASSMTDMQDPQQGSCGCAEARLVQDKDAEYG